jgi:copper chaperone CopZ
MIRIPNPTSKFIVASILGGALAASTPALSQSPRACGDETASPNKQTPTDAGRVQIPVVGMTCGGCAKSIHNALLKVDGIYSAEITFESGRAVVAYDKKKVAVDAIVKAIEQAGYKTGKPTDA